MKFCITGTGRSGTTLLRNLFNMHPLIFVFHETHWIPKMYEFFGTGEADVSRLIDVVEKTFHVTGDPVTEIDKKTLGDALAGRERMTVREFCDVLGSCFASAEGKQLWADKTPDYGPYLETLQKLWPECRFVHVVRHGLETALSMSRHPGFRWMAAAGDMWWIQPSYNRYFEQKEVVDVPLEEFVWLWYWRFKRIRNEASRLSPGSYLEVRFEDLISRPEDLLRRVASFVGLPAAPEWLEHASTAVDPDRVQCSADQIDVPDLKPEPAALLRSLGHEPGRRPNGDLPWGNDAPDLQFVCGPESAEGRDGIQLFLCMRNEATRLPFFLRYYRELGVRTFFVVDNESTDESEALLRREPDVVLFHASGSYSESGCGIRWINTLLHRYGLGRWCLAVDADELLVFPHCERLGLAGLVRFLDSAGANALLTFLLDMYAEGPVAQAEYRPGTPFWETCGYFDSQPYWADEPDTPAGAVPSRGGPRYRVFWEGRDRPRPTPFLRKIPLVRWSDDLAYESSTHLLDGARFTSVTGALLHFKFFSDFVDRAQEEAKRGEHFAGAFQYDVYAEEIRRRPDLTLFHDAALPYQGSRSLVEKGLIRSSPSYESMIDRQTAPVSVDRASENEAEAKSYFIKDGYVCNSDPVPYLDSKDESLTYQLPVYRFVADLIVELGARSLLDVGCGLGLKLKEFIIPLGIDVCGVDLPESINFCLENHESGRWIADDIEDPRVDLGGPFDLIVAADVVEHLSDPDALFSYCARWSGPRTKIVLSTPERDLRRGPIDLGPPGNPAHVREWNAPEFEAYVRSRGLTIERTTVVDLREGMATCQLVLCSWLSADRSDVLS